MRTFEACATPRRCGRGFETGSGRPSGQKLMGVFAEKGVPSTVKAHYVAADGSQGVVLAEADDLEEAYRNILNYSEWIEYETKPYLTIEQALPHIADYVG